MWDPETGLPRQGHPIGYSKTNKEAQAMLAYYRRYGSMRYRYQVQNLEMLVKPKEKKKENNKKK